MIRHPEAEVIAEYREGLLRRRRSVRVRAHLAGCSRCASVEAGLAEVAALLASAPAPPMPSRLVARLDNALAAEVAARQRGGNLADMGAADTGAAGVTAGTGTGAGAAGATVGTGTDRGLTGRRRPADTRPASTRPADTRPADTRPARPRRRLRQRRPAVLAAAAAVTLIVITGGAYGLAQLAHVSGTSPASAGPAAAPAVRGPAISSEGIAAPRAGNRALRPTSAPAGSLPIVHSGTDYLPSRLADQARAVLASQQAVGPPPYAPSSGLSYGGLVGTGQLRACVQRVTGGTRPSLVDLARYRGQPATIIMLAPAGGRAGQVWVVGPGCSAASAGLLAHITLGGTG